MTPLIPLMFLLYLMFPHSVFLTKAKGKKTQNRQLKNDDEPEQVRKRTVHEATGDIFLSTSLGEGNIIYSDDWPDLWVGEGGARFLPPLPPVGAARHHSL